MVKSQEARKILFMLLSTMRANKMHSENGKSSTLSKKNNEINANVKALRIQF